MLIIVILIIFIVNVIVIVIVIIAGTFLVFLIGQLPTESLLWVKLFFF